MFTNAVITCRFNSRRFPGKVLINLDGKPILQHIIDNLRDVVDDVIVATSENSPLITKYCEQNNILFHGRVA